ncbi:hypothetical protein DSCOOX_44730 [Desulfosarcina ovata subsp. ovata]|uniref:Uncharacterized protein n=1 Tax=Desulfosarcina ovata subsp. ovata TaxID=2752305 RepID=A0A5K8AF12_9BACT|nr:hypothetical protein [Desulfosarcina ovata]BBO91293.1 hypothetical protein DSCOOX_44730 [Desulfosarcina ovata subsp. ovata]
MAPILLWSPGNRFVDSLLLGSAVLVVFGFVDDIRAMGYKGKLAGQLIAALIVLRYGGLNITCLGDCLPGGALPQWASLPLTLLVIVRVTNAINLSDDLDGLADGISMMIFICSGVLAGLSERYARSGVAFSGRRGRYFRVPAIQRPSGHHLHGGRTQRKRPIGYGLSWMNCKGS